MTNIWISLVVLICVYISYFSASISSKWHQRVSWFVVITDTALVLWLALGRNVLAKISGDTHWLLYIHILLALGCLVLYFLAAKYGILLARGNETYRLKMRQVGKLIIVTRSLVFITILLVKLYGS